jgi:hypothetical protein
MRSGRTSQKNKDVTFHEAVRDLDTRPQFIRRELSSPRLTMELTLMTRCNRFAEVASTHEDIRQGHHDFYS